MPEARRRTRRARRVARGLDILLASAGFLLAAPLLLVAAVGIMASSPGPVLYKARRVGKDGRPFVLYKLRTMDDAAGGAPITARDDPRVFAFGHLLRTSKLDELPQLWNVIVGDMALVGPRPEDPEIIAEHYTDAERRTLDVRPGLTSPGTLYYYAYGEAEIDDGDPVGSYAGDVLRTKLALDLDYVERAGLAYDLALIGRTAAMIGGRVLGIRPSTTPCAPADVRAEAPRRGDRPDGFDRWPPSVTDRCSR